MQPCCSAVLTNDIVRALCTFEQRSRSCELEIQQPWQGPGQGHQQEGQTLERNCSDSHQQIDLHESQQPSLSNFKHIGQRTDPASVDNDKLQVRKPLGEDYLIESTHPLDQLPFPRLCSYWTHTSSITLPIVYLDCKKPQKFYLPYAYQSRSDFRSIIPKLLPDPLDWRPPAGQPFGLCSKHLQSLHLGLASALQRLL